MPSTEQEYRDYIRELEQQVRLLKEQTLVLDSEKNR